MFEQISVNMQTGEISYPKLEGFVLDKDKLYHTMQTFLTHCSPELAIRQAIHQQLAAHRGMSTLRK